MGCLQLAGLSSLSRIGLVAVEMTYITFLITDVTSCHVVDYVLEH